MKKKKERFAKGRANEEREREGNQLIYAQPCSYSVELDISRGKTLAFCSFFQFACSACLKIINLGFSDIFIGHLCVLCKLM